ncbi:hypothetical protein CSKR_113514 [Clonorchis sinensis]|uniref:Uncharacterized protein n=1 Tax=Clonorchis sinensis TaxID=79923 RepID=A0A3R7DDD6_CLOSI|nr:hypothetical protein CSKR_113514 [Clonorchis sinensis]
MYSILSTRKHLEDICRTFYVFGAMKVCNNGLQPITRTANRTTHPNASNTNVTLLIRVRLQGHRQHAQRFELEFKLLDPINRVQREKITRTNRLLSQNHNFTNGEITTIKCANIETTVTKSKEFDEQTNGSSQVLLVWCKTLISTAEMNQSYESVNGAPHLSQSFVDSWPRHVEILRSLSFGNLCPSKRPTADNTMNALDGTTIRMVSAQEAASENGGVDGQTFYIRIELTDILTCILGSCQVRCPNDPPVDRLNVAVDAGFDCQVGAHTCRACPAAIGTSVNPSKHGQRTADITNVGLHPFNSVMSLHPIDAEVNQFPLSRGTFRPYPIRDAKVMNAEYLTHDDNARWTIDKQWNTRTSVSGGPVSMLLTRKTDPPKLLASPFHTFFCRVAVRALTAFRQTASDWNFRYGGTLENGVTASIDSSTASKANHHNKQTDINRCCESLDGLSLAPTFSAFNDFVICSSYWSSFDESSTPMTSLKCERVLLYRRENSDASKVRWWNSGNTLASHVRGEPDHFPSINEGVMMRIVLRHNRQKLVSVENSSEFLYSPMMTYARYRAILDEESVEPLPKYQTVIILRDVRKALRFVGSIDFHDIFETSTLMLMSKCFNFACPIAIQPFVTRSDLSASLPNTTHKYNAPIIQLFGYHLLEGQERQKTCIKLLFNTHLF